MTETGLLPSDELGIVPSRDRLGRAVLSQQFFIILLALETGSLYLLRWPLLYNFNNFAFWDSGSYLVAHHLFHSGRQPVSEFGWQYGLLPLLIQELAFRVFGASPASFLCLGFPCFLTVAVAIGRIGLLEGGRAARILILLTLPLILSFEPDLPHALEPALLSLGLLAQVRGKYRQSLAFATGACFTKPTMGYFYGVVLLVCAIFRGTQRGTNIYVEPPDALKWGESDRFSLTSVLLPSAITAGCLTLLHVAVFGWYAALHTLLPLSGASAYRALHYGPDKLVKGFFHFPGATTGYYIGTPVSFWICGSLYLTMAALFPLFIATQRALRKIPKPPSEFRSRALRTSRPESPWVVVFQYPVKASLRNSNHYEIVATCAILHIGFILLLYGSSASWTYYAYILVVGVIATDIWPISSRPIAALCVMAALANYSGIRSALSAWNEMNRDPATAGLFAASAERAEWRRVMALTQRRSTTVFTNFGEAAILFPHLRSSSGAFMVAGVATPGEIALEKQRLLSATSVVVPKLPGWGMSFALSPGDETTHFGEDKRLVFRGRYFEVYTSGLSNLQLNPLLN